MKKYYGLRVILAVIFFFSQSGILYAATENLDEIMARKSRPQYSTARRPWQELEDPTTYVWQPETLCYKDVTTGHEVWVLVHGPDEHTIYSTEYGTQAWSNDGSVLGVSIMRPDYRPTRNPAVPPQEAGGWYRKWLVKADGSYLKAAEGYTHATMGSGGWAWANTERAYYDTGSGKRIEGVEEWKLTKNVIAENNVVTGKVILDTSNDPNSKRDDNDIGIGPTKKDVVKRPVSADDMWISLSARANKNYGRHIPCYGHMRVWLNRGENPRIEDHWGVARNAQEYADHLDSREDKEHGSFIFGLDQDYLLMNYHGDYINYLLKVKGSDLDGGPLTELWNAASKTYGKNEVYPHSSGRTPWPDGPHMKYLNHPVIDRWEKYACLGYSPTNTEDQPSIVNIDINDKENFGKGFDDAEGLIANDLSGRVQYDGRHHAWDGWTDHVVFFPYYVGNVKTQNKLMYGRKIDFEAGRVDGLAYPILSTHVEGPKGETNTEMSNDDYNSYPRPSQSPDGTKIAFAPFWLNNYNFRWNSESSRWLIVESKPYLAYVVAYYPYPPTNLEASTQLDGKGVQIRFLPPAYTTRGWPEETDKVPLAREVKRYNVYRRTAASDWDIVGQVTQDYGIVEHGEAKRGIYQPVKDGLPITELHKMTYEDNVNDGTYYYALTTEEHSGLESRELSEIIEVTVSAGRVTNTSIRADLPRTGFWTKKPPAPVLKVEGTPGHYQLSWREPDDPKIRYYNIYYSTTDTTPDVIQQNRIASLPKGTTKYLDWLSDSTRAGYYTITSVDRQGNESTLGPQLFIRGDVDGSGNLDLGDVVSLIGYVFGGRAIPCLDAADVNDSGALDLADIVCLINYIFGRGSPPSAPFPEAGEDPTADGLGCGGG